MIYIYGLYIVLSGLILAFFHKKSLNEWLLKMTVVSVLPIVGWFLPILWPRRMIANQGDWLAKYMNKQDEFILANHIDQQEQVEKKKELDVVSIEDALLISENSTRRKVMIDVLKEDSFHYLEALQSAVENDDLETSYYAVSGITEVKRKLSLSLQELSVKYERDKSDKYLRHAYAEVLRDYMRSGFLDARTIRKYKYTYVDVLANMIENDDEIKYALEEKSRTELELGEYMDAEKTSILYLIKYPLCEEAYLNIIGFYFTVASHAKLQKTIEIMKSSNIVLSNRALTIVRYWSEGTEHGRESKIS